MSHLHLNYVFAFLRIETFRNIIFLKIEKWEMSLLISIRWAHMILHAHWDRQFNCVVWLNSVACSDEHVARLYMFRLSAFQCSLSWRCWSHDATLDSEEFLIFILYLTILLLYRVDVILMLQTSFLILSLLSISVLLLQM